MKNLDFILEKLSMFYKEVCEFKDETFSAIDYKEMQRCLCGNCGKTFTNKRGLKQHILRMHGSKGNRIKFGKIKTNDLIMPEDNDKTTTSVENSQMDNSVCFS